MDDFLGKKTYLHQKNENTSMFNKIKMEEKIRSIGIRLGELDTKEVEQVSLFSNKNNDNIQKLLDNINAKYQNTVVMPAIFYEKDKI